MPSITDITSASADNLTKLNPADMVPTGSVYLNNTSYSGADIKVLICMPDGGKGNDERTNYLQKEITRTQEQLDRLQQNIAKAEFDPITPHQGTQEAFLSGNLIQAYAEEQDRLDETLKGLQGQLNSLSKSPSPRTKVLAECQSISISTFRKKDEVRACGSVYPKAFTRGPRSIAGSLVFTVFDQNVLWEMMEAHASDFDANNATSAILDQLPPVDILIAFANEYGSLSRMTIYGVEFVSEGQVMSIEDLLTENTVSYVARDLDPMRAVGTKVKMDNGSAWLQQDFIGKKASDLLYEDDYLAIQKDSPYDRFLQRRNPFL